MLETQQNDNHLGAVLRRVDEYFDRLDLPKLEADVEAPKVISISDLEDCTNKDLENYLLLFGGFRSYLDAKLASVESRKTILEATFEEGLNRMLYLLEEKYGEEGRRRPNKESLRGEAIATNSSLKRTRQESIEAEGMYIRLAGIRNAYKSMYDAVSRVVALRVSSGEQV